MVAIAGLQPEGFVSFAASVLGLSGMVAGAIGVMFSGRQTATIKVLQDSNAALTQRVDTIVAQEEECQKRLDDLEEANQVLKGLVTGDVAVQLLADRMDKQHREVLAAIAQIRGGS